MTISGLQAAKKICEISGWSITNLRLQKILYLAHKVYMGENKEPLVFEQFEAWTYGPVLPVVYDRVKIFGADHIENIFLDIPDIAEDSKEAKILKEACDQLLANAGWELVALTHRPKSAWFKCYHGGYGHYEIPNDEIMKEYER